MSDSTDLRFTIVQLSSNKARSKFREPESKPCDINSRMANKSQLKHLLYEIFQ